MDSKFEKAWAAMTIEFRDTHGGLGSCLHKDEDGNLIAYARWPDSQVWKNDKTILNTVAMNEMIECIEKSFPAVPLEVINDLLDK